jgi:hypothetical protein
MMNKQLLITWIQLPIVDDEVPNKAFEGKWKQYQALILATIDNGDCVTIHYVCYFGKLESYYSLNQFQR